MQKISRRQGLGRKRNDRIFVDSLPSKLQEEQKSIFGYPGLGNDLMKGVLVASGDQTPRITISCSTSLVTRKAEVLGPPFLGSSPATNMDF